MEWVIGVDEAGRGPLAGPVAVGVVKVPGNFAFQAKLPGVTDSKQLSEKRREELFQQAQALQKAGDLEYAVAMVSAGVIDREGIARAIALAMARALHRLTGYTSQTSIAELAKYHVLLDGSLSAPQPFSQETIIKGDVSEPAIGLASIMAKVTRDRYMLRQAHKPEFSIYDFTTHKGYGTKAHRTAIANHGLSAMHRQSYFKNIKVL